MKWDIKPPPISMHVLLEMMREANKAAGVEVFPAAKLAEHICFIERVDALRRARLKEPALSTELTDGQLKDRINSIQSNVRVIDLDATGLAMQNMPEEQALADAEVEADFALRAEKLYAQIVENLTTIQNPDAEGHVLNVTGLASVWMGTAGYGAQPIVVTEVVHSCPYSPQHVYVLTRMLMDQLDMCRTAPGKLTTYIDGFKAICNPTAKADEDYLTIVIHWAVIMPPDLVPEGLDPSAGELL